MALISIFIFSGCTSSENLFKKGEISDNDISEVVIFTDIQNDPSQYKSITEKSKVDEFIKTLDKIKVSDKENEVTDGDKCFSTNSSKLYIELKDSNKEIIAVIQVMKDDSILFNSFKNNYIKEIHDNVKMANKLEELSKQ